MDTFRKAFAFAPGTSAGLHAWQSGVTGRDKGVTKAACVLPILQAASGSRRGSDRLGKRLHLGGASSGVIVHRMSVEMWASDAMPLRVKAGEHLLRTLLRCWIVDLILKVELLPRKSASLVLSSSKARGTATLPDDVARSISALLSLDVAWRHPRNLSF